MSKLDVQVILYAEVGGKRYRLTRLGDEGAIDLEIADYNFIDDKETTSTYELVEESSIQLALDVVKMVCETIAEEKQAEHDEGVIYHRSDAE